ncbi:MAG: acetyl-CoA hydrolase/transferase family protein [Acidimicrobiales bacterium]
MGDADRIDFTPYLPAPRGGRLGRWVSAEEAVAAIPDHSRVYVAGDSMLPGALTIAMTEAADRWTDIEIVNPGLLRRVPLFRRAGRPFRFVSTHASRVYRDLWALGAVDVLPTKLSDLHALFTPDGPLPCDVAVIHVSPPGPEGKVSLGVSVGVSISAALTAPLVIAQVNPQVPYVFGAGEIPVEEIDYLVELEEPFSDWREGGELDPVSARIAELAAGLVVDGATIQFGNGVLPDAILRQLSTRTGLRVHSGLVSEACADLYEAGVVEGPMVATQLMSTPRLRAWAHRNPAVQLGPLSYTHGPGVLASLERFTALLSTVEVALDGAANSEMRGEETISAPGGAPDFAFGASLVNGGRLVVALPSTAAGGAVSRVVRRIEPPRPVTLPGYLADAIVTEHGVAEVRGLTLARRAQAIAGLAAPAHRAGLLA